MYSDEYERQPFGPGGPFGPRVPFGPGVPGVPGGPLGPGGPFGPGMPSAAPGMPPGPPPAAVPQQPQVGTFAVDPGAIFGCLYRYIYIWPRFGRPFWAWLVFVGRTSAAGYRWTGFRWVYFAIDLRLIDYFQCY